MAGEFHLSRIGNSSVSFPSCFPPFLGDCAAFAGQWSLVLCWRMEGGVSLVESIIFVVISLWQMCELFYLFVCFLWCL